MLRSKWCWTSIGVAAALVPALALAQGPITRQVSGNAFTVPFVLGVDAPAFSSPGSISDDGRFVAFSSAGTNLVSGDSNGLSDVFLRVLEPSSQFRVSLTQSGSQGNNTSSAPAVSATGRFVAFVSSASNLVPGDTNGRSDVFVRELGVGGTVTRVSVTQTGGQATQASSMPAISADGRFVAFSSASSNLVASDTNGVNDIFVRDRIAGTTEIVSVSTAGQIPNASSVFPSISADGRYVAFRSAAANLVGDDTNGVQDVFVRDRVARTTERASIPAAGGQANGHSFTADISGSGRYVVFDSIATNLVSGDANDANDIFVRDRIAGTTTRVSVNTGGTEGNDSSRDAVISADGRHVAFVTDATNLGLLSDGHAGADIYLRDLASGNTQVVSIDPSRLLFGSGDFGGPSISADGRLVVFDGVERTSPQVSRIVWLRDRAVDPGVRLSVSEASATEGSVFGSGSLLFTVFLSARTPQNVTFRYWTEDVTAHGPDYARSFGTASIPAGELVTTIAIPVRGDSACELQETMNLNIDVPEQATIADGQGVGTIRDDDCRSRTVGDLDLFPADAVVTAGERATYEVSWTVPSDSWQDLDSLEFRIGEGGEVLWLRFDETTRTFAVVNPRNGRIGPAFAAGSPNVLTSRWARVHLADTQLETAGPDSPEVSLRLSLSFSRRVAGAAYPIEVQAINDAGEASGFEQAGVVTVVSRRSHHHR